MLCWQCGAEIPADAQTCPECDAELGETPRLRVRRGELRCPECGSTWDREEEICPECGMSPFDDIPAPDETDL